MPMPQNGHAGLSHAINSLRTLTVGRLSASRLELIGMVALSRSAVLQVKTSTPWMVHEGWALAFVRYSIAYVKEEEKAHTAQRGLWSGAFIAPWDRRHRDKGSTILGPLSVPITAQKQLLEPVSAESAPSHNCIIKGNVNREGEHIYHMPGGNSYAKINMDAPGKRWFCSEDEAKAAGWRPPKR